MATADEVAAYIEEHGWPPPGYKVVPGTSCNACGAYPPYRWPLWKRALSIFLWYQLPIIAGLLAGRHC